MLTIICMIHYFVTKQSVLQATSRGGQQDGSDLMSALQISTTNNGQQQTGVASLSSSLQLQLPALFAKRQGVSGESSDLHNHHNHHHGGGHHQHTRLPLPNNQQQGDISLLVTTHDKDFRQVSLFFIYFLKIARARNSWFRVFGRDTLSISKITEWIRKKKQISSVRWVNV